jgi:hypothetical protein
MLAILEAYRAGLLNPRNWGSNVVAGLIVGVVALPKVLDSMEEVTARLAALS